jgi:hypothetical protein
MVPDMAPIDKQLECKHARFSGPSLAIRILLVWLGRGDFNGAEFGSAVG